MNKIVSSVYVILSAVLWGIISLFYGQLSATGLSALQIVWLRCTTATLMVMIYILISDRSLLKIKLRDIWMFLGSGVISLAFFNYCYFEAIDEASASTAAVLLYTAPIFVTILSACLFKERLTLPKIVAVILTMAGCICVTELFTDARITTKGLLFGLGAGIGYALYSIFGKIALRHYRTETITAYTFLFASISVFPLCRFTQLTELVVYDPIRTLSLSLAIGVVSTLLPYLLYTKGLQRVSAGQASIMATVEPVVATLVGTLLLHERMSFAKIVGIILIIVAIILIGNTKEKKREDDI